MEQVLFSLPLNKLEPVFKGWVRDVLESQQAAKEPTPQKKYLQAQASADFLGITLSTFYTKSSRGELPTIKRNGKLYCLQSDLEDYLEQGRRKTNAEIATEANNYLSKK